ncbi:PTS sugar transporter subunit IIA [Bacillus salipaludis]|uniref:PTS sugar transporter subunit IIA n=1 Tax=Bacillus salipaludis TaxID=2547811 RepID=UPI002E1A1639|nr:PTS sugar transporter subunit IIA [Bacillus salipaludis]
MLLTEKTVQVRPRVGDWVEAIRMASNPLVADGSVTGGYVQSMIDNVKSLGPYIVIVPQIAIPHARPEQGVKKLAMSMLCLENPVSFSEKEEHQVRLVIVLAAIDHKQHLQALSELVTLLADEDKVVQIMSASTSEEVLSVVHRA